MRQGKKIILITSVILLISLILHLVEFQHNHPHEIFGEGIQATMHGEDKKLWALLVALKFLSLAGIFSLVNFIGLYFQQYKIFSKIFRRAGYVLECLSRGVLQPKICN